MRIEVAVDLQGRAKHIKSTLLAVRWLSGLPSVQAVLHWFDSWRTMGGTREGKGREMGEEGEE